MARKTAARAGVLTDKAEAALRKVEKSSQFHDALVNRMRVQTDAYEGVLRASSDAAQWQSQLHPPILNHIVEVSIAPLLEDALAYKITPKPRFFDPGEYERMKQGARAHEILFRQQLAADRFNEFQRPFVLQAALYRMSVAKTYWRNDVRTMKRLEAVPVIPGIPYPVRLKEVSRQESCFDGPVTETVDLRDFYWHEAAVSLDKARWCAHAIWMSIDDIKRFARRGVYDEAAVSEIDMPSDPADERSDVERDREQRGRKKDMVEVLEIWDRETGMVTTIAARRVQLAQKEWPFWHGEYPFVTTSLAPFPFSLQGLSLVEKLKDLQDAYWDLLNQTADNTRLINNAIVNVASDMDDPDSYEYAPGAVNVVERADQVTMWTPNVSLATVAMPLMQQYQQHMQNLAAAQPFTSTSEARTSGANTATEAALVTNMAQQSTSKMKAQLYYAYQRIGQQRMRLNQQFIREPVYVEQIGLNQQSEILEILPTLLQGDYLFDITPMTESLMRSERRAEAQALYQIAVQSAPVMAAVQQPWNMKAFGDKLLDSFDIQDKEQFYSSQPQQQLQGGAPGQGGEQPAVGQEGPGGVTAPQSIDPAVSPSNQASLAPSVFMQRAGAMGGGIANDGGGG